MFEDRLFTGITVFLFLWFFASIFFAYRERKNLKESGMRMYGEEGYLDYYDQRQYNEAYEQMVTPPAILLLIWGFAILEVLLMAGSK